MEKPPFVDDISIKHCLTGILLRAPSAGLLEDIRTPRLPSNTSLITAADIPGVNGFFVYSGPQRSCGGSRKIPLLAEKKLLHRGQPAGLLLGPDPAKLRELAGQCTVLVQEGEEQEIMLERTYHNGDTEGAFERAARVVEGRYRADLYKARAGEAPGAIALPGPGGEMIIHAPTQWPGHIRNSVARVLNIKAGSVEVHGTRCRIRCDEKLWFPSFLAALAAVAARVRNRPVKIVLKREDFFFESAGADIRIQSALNEQGEVLGSRVNISARPGSFGLFAGEILDRIALGALGAYSHGSVSLRARGYTNPPVIGGFGLAQGFFAAERQASRIADVLGEDPSEWRKKFFLRKGNRLSIGVEIREEPPLEELLDAVAAMGDYCRKWAANELLRKSRRERPRREKPREPLRGIGIALAYQGSGFLYSPADAREGVELTLEKDGSLEIRTDFPLGDNQIHAWKVLAARILGVEELRISSRDADRTIPESGPACLSRGILLTRLIEKACTAIRRQRFRDPLPITARRYCQILKTPAWSGQICNENALSPLSWGSAVVETEIDPVEYVPRIRGIWMALDGGQILAEDRARKSTVLGVLEALAPTHRPEEVPPPVIDFLWSQGNIKGIGELAINTVPAAYIQALSQALDYPFEKYPVKSGDIWEAVRRFSGIQESESAEIIPEEETTEG
ncbi:MAG: molybdopterin-dependent oxidoreductase [Treponema sp.]|nr:molybdopterin-dependent oxidoreductase [Treponema sp.]